MADQTKHSLTTPSASESRSLCTCITAKGRRCRYPVHKPASHLCKLHARPRRVPLAEPEANPLAGLSPEISAFRSYADISQFLARLLTLLAENRISPRRAAVLSYVANSLLNSLRAAERLAQYETAHEPEEEFHMDFSHMSAPGPDSSQSTPLSGSGSSDSSLAKDVSAEVRPCSDPTPAPISPQPPSASLQVRTHDTAHDRPPVQPATPPALGGHVPQRSPVNGTTTGRTQNISQSAAIETEAAHAGPPQVARNSG